MARSRQQALPPTRQPVLFDPPELVIPLLRGTPGQWFLVAGDSYARKNVLTQTGYAIRTGKYAGFPLPKDGVYISKVVARQSTREFREHDAELYLRFVPHGVRTVPRHPIG